MAEVFPDLVVYDEEGKPFTVKYHLLSSMLVNELQKLHERAGKLEEAGARALAELDELRAEVSRLQQMETRLAALEENGHHIANTARDLGLERSHLYKKMRALGIQPRGGSASIPEEDE